MTEAHVTAESRKGGWCTAAATGTGQFQDAITQRPHDTRWRTTAYDGARRHTATHARFNRAPWITADMIILGVGNLPRLLAAIDAGACHRSRPSRSHCARAGICARVHSLRVHLSLSCSAAGR
eukprot:7377903-Prymnesium_polylepis.1